MAESDKNKRTSSSLHAEKDISKLKVMQSAEADGIAAKYCMSVLAAWISESVTYPLDLTKTRLQLQGEIAAGEKNVKRGDVNYRGMFRTALGIAKEEVLRTYIIDIRASSGVLIFMAIKRKFSWS